MRIDENVKPWLADDGAGAPDHVASLLRSAARDEPSAAQLARLHARLEGRLGDAAGAAVGASARGIARGWFVASGAAVVGVASLLLALAPRRSDQPPGARPAARAVVQPAPTPRVPPAVALTRPEHPQVSSDVRADQPAVRAAHATPAVPAAVPAAAPSEIELIDGARAALQVGAPGRAVRLAAQHARSYPAGVFAEEREFLAVQALVRLGRRSEAAARATRFAARYPRSVYTARIDALLGGPPAAP